MKNNWVRHNLKIFNENVDWGYEYDRFDEFCYDVEFINAAIAAQDEKLKKSDRRARTRNAVARRKNFFKAIWMPDIFEQVPAYDHRIKSCSSPCDWKYDRRAGEQFHNRKTRKASKKEINKARREYIIGYNY